MEAKKKNWNTKAKIGYAKMFQRICDDETRRNGGLNDPDGAKGCMTGLKELDSLAAGSLLSGGDLSLDRVNRVIAEATTCDGLLTTHLTHQRTSSDGYRSSVRQLQQAVNQLSQAGAGITNYVEQADEDKKRKVAGLLVQKQQCDAAVDAALTRIAELSKDIGKAISANDEKAITKLTEKVKKMENEYNLIVEKYNRVNEGIRECIN